MKLKRLISALLLFAMLLSCLPLTALAVETGTPDVSDVPTSEITEIVDADSPAEPVTLAAEADTEGENYFYLSAQTTRTSQQLLIRPTKVYYDADDTIAQALLIPCLIILIVLMAGAVWQIGDIVVEYIAERRKHKCEVPQLLRDVHTAGADGLADLIENSGLLRRQKKALLELAESRNLPKDTLTALAERLLATEEARNARTTSVTDMIAKLGPMFGLLGTLIPLGPGIVALGQGDTVTLSESMNVAFDTTIAGVISAAVASVISHIRKRWYNDDMVSLETLMEAVLEEVTSDVEG